MIDVACPCLQPAQNRPATAYSVKPGKSGTRRSPALTSEACGWLVRDNADRGISLGIHLADMGHLHGDQAMTVEDILTRPRVLDAAPWADLKGAPLDARGLWLISSWTPVTQDAGGYAGRPGDSSCSRLSCTVAHGPTCAHTWSSFAASTCRTVLPPLGQGLSLTYPGSPICVWHTRSTALAS